MQAQRSDLTDHEARLNMSASDLKAQHFNYWIEAPAKINLTLDIKGKRPDGYHELETMMHQITLVDRIGFRRGGQGIRLNTDSPDIPADEQNLAYKAARLLFEKFNLQEGIQIFIEKNIPVGAGLAGGSTDAAAVLTGINRLFDLGLEEKQLLELGGGLGSDVPFCLLGGTALGRGRGEILTPIKNGPKLTIVLVKPDFQISTSEVYSDFRMDRVKKFPDNEAFISAWQSCDIISVSRQLNNVLESVSIQWHPRIADIKEQLCELGALNALMSGSGPSVFGIFTRYEIARQAWAHIKQQYPQTYLLSTYKKGEKYD